MTVNYLPSHHTMPAAVRFVDMIVTPEQALDWITQPRYQHPNRRLDPAKIALYAKAMYAGEWLFDGSAIRFSDNEQLLDGQNRLHAIVEAGVPVRMLVIWGLADETQDVMDSGKPRSAANVLEIHGYVNATTVAAVSRLLIGVETDTLQANHAGTIKANNQTVLVYAGEHPDVMTIITMAGNHPVSWAKASAYLAAMVLVSRVNREVADEFHALLSSGAGLQPGSPILALRERMIRARSMGVSISAYATISAVMRCWNAWRTGQQMKTFMVLGKDGNSIPIPDKLR